MSDREMQRQLWVAAFASSAQPGVESCISVAKQQSPSEQVDDPGDS